ncbi:MAG: EAL domain-containing protein [Sphingobium sp.]|nr:EAL domain-containing protein [Sphingobium sp.]
MPGSLSAFSGEFRDQTVETAFRAERLDENRMHARIVVALAVVMNALFLLADWRVSGTPQLTVPTRLTNIVVSTLCFLALGRMRSVSGVERVMVAWMGTTALGVATLVGSRGEGSLFIVLLLPMIYYLVVPVSFRWTLIGAMGCSALMLGGYALRTMGDPLWLGLGLALLALNTALPITVARINRIRRQEWAAARAEYEARAAQAEYREALETIFMTVPVPLVVTHEDGRIERFNKACTDFFDRPAGMAPRTKVKGFYVHAEDRQRLMDQLRAESRIDNFETQLYRYDGSIRDALISGSLVHIGDDTRYVVSIVDITNRKLTEQRLIRLARTDALTNIANRAAFLESAGHALAEAGRNESRAAMVLVDVDDFKRVNDQAGHDAGDALLCAIAAALNQSTRPQDVIARLGGDEFAILLTDIADEAELTALLDAISQRLRQPLTHGDRTLEPRVSMGLSLFPDDARDMGELIKCADIAMYEAKTRGRGQLCRFEARLLDNWEREAAMLARARSALGDGSIQPFYQPKIDLVSGAIRGFEALLRCVDADGAVAMPGTLGAAFEHPELGPAITARMIRRVVDDMRGWIDAGIVVDHVAVNMSGSDLRDPGFADHLLLMLDSAGIPRQMFEAEVTESVFLGDNAEAVGRNLRTLSQAGVRIALDDFGTGYASLSHLKQFPINVIKIDQQFVRDLEDDPDDAAIVRAVLNLSYSLGLETVAEGIETQTQADYLRAGGCQMGQGFLFSPAVPARDVPAMIRQGQLAFTPARRSA